MISHNLYMNSKSKDDWNSDEMKRGRVIYVEWSSIPCQLKRG